MADKYGHNKVECVCKDCRNPTLKRTDQLKKWSGRCLECAKKYRRDSATWKHHGETKVACKDCGKKWSKRNDGIKKWKGYCIECSQKYKHSTPEQKEKCRVHMKKVRTKYKGKMPLPDYKSGEQHTNWKGGKPKCKSCGKQVSAYEAKYCKDCIHETRKGENHWQWKGGISGENVRVRQSKEYKQWRQDVFKRDGWCCIICGYRSKKRGDIKADHIKPFHLFHELRLDIDNGRTLCLNCDYVYGYNHNRDKGKIININTEIDRKISWKEAKMANGQFISKLIT